MALSTRQTWRRSVVPFVLMLVMAAQATAEQSRDLAPEDTVEATRHLARTLRTITGSTAERPQVLRILFYGQSITSPKWIDPAMAHLRRMYPNTVFDVRNLAIGGFSAQMLEHAAERDLADAYPDLIVFHVYGDHHAYERIVRLMRSRTAADVILQTDHVTVPVEPLCRAGLRLSWTPPPGCTGLLWYKQRSWEEFMSGTLVPDLARRYGLAIDPRRLYWNEYLQQHKLEPRALLADAIHPNDQGWRLMTQLFEAYVDRVVTAYRIRHGNSAAAGPGPSVSVSALPRPRSAAPVTYEITGNRVEILASGPLDGHIRATIDGRPTTQLPGCWLTSRVSSLPGVPDWPAIRQVKVDPSRMRLERWTARVTGLTRDQSDFTFTLASSLSGMNGRGVGSADFVSPSADVRIASDDWVIPLGYSAMGKKVPEGASFSWTRDLVCHDQPPLRVGPGEAMEVRHVVATGMDDGRHRLRLEVHPEALALLRDIRLYRPSLPSGS